MTDQNTQAVQMLRRRLSLSRTRLENQWHKNAANTITAPGSDGKPARTLVLLHDISNGFALYGAPAQVLDTDETGHATETDGLCWGWALDGVFLGRVWEAPYEWFAANGPPLPSQLLAMMESGQIVLDGIPTPAPTPDSAPKLAPAKSATSGTQRQADVRQILEPTFQAAGARHAPALRKKIAPILPETNAARMQKKSRKIADELKDQGARYDKKLLWVIAVLVIAAPVLWYAPWQPKASSLQKANIASDQEGTRYAKTVGNGDGCIDQAFKSPVSLACPEGCEGGPHDPFSIFLHSCLSSLPSEKMGELACKSDNVAAIKEKYCKQDANKALCARKHFDDALGFALSAASTCMPKPASP